MPLAPESIDPGKLYTVFETADMLQLSEQTVRKHLRDSRLRGRKIGKRWHIRGAEIRKYIGELD
jgi:excisionase family DNA binding protein